MKKEESPASAMPDKLELNMDRVNKALADVIGQPALRATKVEVVLDKEYWKEICRDPWSGNVYKYSF